MSDGTILVVNPGSSSLKLSLLGPGDEVAAAESGPGEDIAGAIRGFLARRDPDACGVRVVHGGHLFRGPTPVDSEVLAALEELRRLAPLHNPPALDAIRAIRETHPDLPLVACFDTSFFVTLPDAVATYAIPWAWTAELGIRRFGFHGLSHAYASRRAAERLGTKLSALRLVTCHLGAGASLAAVHGGVAVDTTMGFTPLEGLVMATRSGSVDPGALLWLQQTQGLSANQVEKALESESGLLGLSGISGEMEQVLAGEQAGEARAHLAVEVYVHRLRGAIAIMAAAMQGLDALVFTGGVGEHAPQIRARAARGLGFLGLRIDPARNDATAGDGEITAPGATARSFVVTAREDLEIAQQVRLVAGFS